MPCYTIDRLVFAAISIWSARVYYYSTISYHCPHLQPAGNQFWPEITYEIPGSDGFESIAGGQTLSLPGRKATI